MQFNRFVLEDSLNFAVLLIYCTDEIYWSNSRPF